MSSNRPRPCRAALARRRAQVARQVQTLRARTYEPANEYEYDHARAWLYCLDWVLGGSQGDEEGFDAWVARLANET